MRPHVKHLLHCGRAEAAERLADEMDNAFGVEGVIRGMGRPQAITAMMTLLIVLSQPPGLFAQSPGSAGITTSVQDATGAVLRGVAVSVTNLATGVHRRGTTDALGRCTFAELPVTGSYRLELARSGFRDTPIEPLALRVDEIVQLTVRLVASGQTAVTVLGTAAGLRSDSQLGIRLGREALDESALPGRKVTSLVLLDSSVRPARATGDLFLNVTLFVVNGAGRRQTTFLVDGSTNDDGYARQTLFANVPITALEEFVLTTSAFSPEYGRTAGSVVNMITRSGTNSWIGDGIALWRPAGLASRPPLSGQSTNDSLLQVGGSIGGPVVHDRTHVFVALERNQQTRDVVVTSPLAPGQFTGDFRQTLIFGRLDQRLNANSSLTVRANSEQYTDTNPADTVGGTTLPSAGRIFLRRTFAAQVSGTTILDSATTLAIRTQLQTGSPVSRFTPVSPSTQYEAPGWATLGESRASDIVNHVFQGSLGITRLQGRHGFSMGGEAIRISVGGFGQDLGNAFPLGQFTLKPGVMKPIDKLLPSDIQRFVQSFGDPSWTVGEWMWAAYIRDKVVVHRDVSVDLGLRYERQTLTDARHNFGPRLAIVWNPSNSRRTVLRTGLGVHYSEVRANAAAGYLLGGPEGVFTFSAAPGQIAFPADVRPLRAIPSGVVIPPRDIMVRAGARDYVARFLDAWRLRGYPEDLRNPYTTLMTLGIEHQLSANTFISGDYVSQVSRDFYNAIDLNAPEPFDRTQPGQVRSPAAADLTRPIVPHSSGYRRILVLMNHGQANYNGLQVQLRRQGAAASILASYTFSHSTNTVEPDVPSAPNDFTQLGATERADSLLDQRHRAVISGLLHLSSVMRIGGIATIGAGLPYNVITGVDNNGDGVSGDRPVIGGRVIGRNTGRGSAILSVDAFVEARFKVRHHAAVVVRGEGFNLLNHSNIVARNGIFGNDPSGIPLPTFGAPVGGLGGVDPGRQFQFSARVRLGGMDEPSRR